MEIMDSFSSPPETALFVNLFYWTGALVVVEISVERQEVTLLGFAKKVRTGELAMSQLQAVDNTGVYCPTGRMLQREGQTGGYYIASPRMLLFE